MPPEWLPSEDSGLDLREPPQLRKDFHHLKPNTVLDSHPDAGPWKQIRTNPQQDLVERHPQDTPLSFLKVHPEAARQDMYPNSGTWKNLSKGLFGVGVYACTLLLPTVIYRRLTNKRRADDWTFREEVGVEVLRYMLNTKLDIARRNTRLIEWILQLSPTRVSFKTVEILDVNLEVERTSLEMDSLQRNTSLRTIKRRPRKAVAHWIGCDAPTPQSFAKDQADGVDPGLVLLYFHGGGYTVGSALFMIMSFTSLLHSLKKNHPDTRIRICAIDYPLAPEAVFPSAVDSALTSYRWLLKQPGISSARIAVGGDSAGGGLTLALIQKLRFVKPSLPPFCGVALISPWVDISLASPSATRNAETDVITCKAASDMVRFYLTAGCKGPEADAYVEKVINHPMVSPINAELSGLPPTLVIGGKKEIFYDDLVRFVEKARAAGVAVEADFSDVMVHAYVHMEIFLGERASVGIRVFANFLSRLAEAGRPVIEPPSTPLS